MVTRECDYSGTSGQQPDGVFAVQTGYSGEFVQDSALISLAGLLVTVPARLYA